MGKSSSGPCWSNDGLQILYQNLLGLKLVPANGLGGTNVPGTNFIGDFDLR